MSQDTCPRIIYCPGALFAIREQVVLIFCRSAHLRWGFSTILAALVCLWAAAAHAQVEPASDTVVTVGSPVQGYEDPRFASGFVSRVKVTGLFETGRDLGDALTHVPGLYVRRQSSLGQPAYLTVRGGTPRQVVVRLEGQRISLPTGMGFDVGQLSTSGLKSADVYRGSAATIHGAGALTGALQLNAALPSEPGWQVSATSMGGSFGTWGQAAGAEFAGPFAGQHAGLRLDAGWRQSEGDFAFVDEQGVHHRRVNNGHQRLSLMGSGNIASGAHSLRVTSLFEQGASGSPGPSEFQERFSDASTEDRRAIAIVRWQGKSLADGSWGALDAQLGAGFQRRDVDYNNSHGVMTREEFRNTSAYQSLSATGGMAGFLNIGNSTHLDLEARRETYEATYEGRNFHAGADAPTDTLAANRHTLGAGISNELLLFSQRVSIIGGVRAELIADDEFEAYPLLPSAGVIWRTTPWLRLLANGARTFRAPDFDELYIETETVRGDPGLEPERALSWDAGVALGQAGGPLVLQVAYFESQTADMILFLPVSAHLFKAVNLPASEAYGAESTLNVHPHRRLGLDLSYTLTLAHLVDDASGVEPSQLPHQPRHRAVAGVKFDASRLGFWGALHALHLTSSLHYRSTVYLDNFGNLSNPPAIIWNAGTAVGVYPWLNLEFNAYNLLDHQRGQDSLQRPLPGRSIFVSLQLSAEGT